MTPWLHEVFADLSMAAARALGLGPEVEVEAVPAQGAVRVRVRPPGHGERVLLVGQELVHESGGRGATWEAIVRLHRAWGRREPERRAELERERLRVAHLEGLTDSVYRRRFVGPTGATGNLRLGFACNQDCGLCWQNRRWPDPPAALLRVWLDELAAAGVTQLTITGGEPTFRPELPELVERAHARGMRVMVQTNAVLLGERGRAAELYAAGVDRLFVSLHAADPALSDRITRAPGTHARTLAGLRAALDAGLRVGVSTVVDRSNVDHLPELARFIVTELAQVESVTWSKPQPYFDRALWADRLPSIAEVEEPLLQAVDRVAGAGIVVDATSGSCGLPACLLRARPEHIHLPPATSLGAADDGFDADERAPACRRCALADRCQGPGRPWIDAQGEVGLVPFERSPELPERFPLTL